MLSVTVPTEVVNRGFATNTHGHSLSDALQSHPRQFHCVPGKEEGRKGVENIVCSQTVFHIIPYFSSTTQRIIRKTEGS